MDFPPEVNIDDDAECAEYCLGVVEELMKEHRSRAAEIKAGTLTVPEFKAWEKAEWMPAFKHAKHVADQYMIAAGKRGKPDLEPGTPEEEAYTAEQCAFKEKAKKNNKFKAHLEATDNRALVSKWDASMNSQYVALQKRAAKKAGKGAKKVKPRE